MLSSVPIPSSLPVQPADVFSMTEKPILISEQGSDKLSDSQSLVSEISQEIMNLVSGELRHEMAEFVDSLQSLPSLTAIIRAQANPDHLHYEKRLLADEATLQRVFEKRILTHPVLAEFMKGVDRLFYQDEALRKCPAFKTTILQKLRKPYFDDVIYDILTDREYPKSKMITIWEYLSLAESFSRFQKAGEDKIKIASIQWLFKICQNTKDTYRLVQEAGNAGIRNLNLWNHGISQYLDFEELLTLMQIAGRSGIRILHLTKDELWENTNIDNRIRLVREAGNSGIKKLNIDLNHVYQQDGIVEMTRLVRTAGLHGIRSLDLLRTKMSVKDMCLLVQAAGESDIFKVEFRRSSIWKLMDVEEIYSIVRIAGKSWVRCLILWAEYLTERLGWKKGCKRLVEEARKLGIRRLWLWTNVFLTESI